MNQGLMYTPSKTNEILNVFPLFKGAISKAKYSYPSTIFSWDMRDMLVFGDIVSTYL